MPRRKCKYPNCRKMVTYSEEEIQTEYCCSQHVGKCDTYEKPDECPICCSEFTEGVPLFPCCHWICKKCVIQSGKEDCPVCRQPVILAKVEEKQLLRVKKQLDKDKMQQQMEEDRRLAQEIQQRMREEEATHGVPRIVQIVVTEENMNEILEILGALDNTERVVYLRALGIQEN